MLESLNIDVSTIKHTWSEVKKAFGVREDHDGHAPLLDGDGDGDNTGDGDNDDGGADDDNGADNGDDGGGEDLSSDTTPADDSNAVVDVGADDAEGATTVNDEIGKKAGHVK